VTSDEEAERIMNTKADILLVIPSNLSKRGFPVGASTLSSILSNDGFNIQLVDMNAFRMSAEDAVKDICRRAPFIVCFTGLWGSFKELRTVSSLLRKQLPSITQIAGGWWAGPIPKIILEETSMDCVVRGEADLVITALCRYYLEQESTKLNLPGVCYLDEQGSY